MENKPSSKPSFSSGQRWTIFISVVFSIIFVAAILLMLNYLASRYIKRVSWANAPQNRLSLQTIALLKNVTNKVAVTVYYNKADSLYPLVDELLQEYHFANPKIMVDRVDYLTDASRAQKVKAEYKLTADDDKNLVVFECEGRRKIIPSALLANYKIEGPFFNGVTNEFVRHLQTFNGEMCFSGAMLSVTSPKSNKAYFLEGHGEHSIRSESADADGYKKLVGVLEGYNITPNTLKLYGTNNIPRDCSLLIIAGPRRTIPQDELMKIQQYLVEGGRMFVLFNSYTVLNDIPTGLEALLQQWNIRVGNNIIADPENTLGNGAIVVNVVTKASHPIVNPMVSGSGLAMFNPRSIEAMQPSKQSPGAPEAKALMFTGDSALVGPGTTPTPAKANVPLIVAVEKGRVQGVVSERGTTAMVVAGDSTFLNNSFIDLKDNRDFAGFVVNWLLDQNQLLQGVGPHAVKEYTLSMTQSQIDQIRWIFLGAMPGGILLLGFMVWLRRRN